MAMTQEEATRQLIQTNEVLVRVGTETDALLREIQRLEEELANAGGVGQPITKELEAAIHATHQRATAIDNLVQDVPNPEQAR